MLVKKADDYQSWYIEEEDYGILIDPWLDSRLNPNSSFFIQRIRKTNHNLSREELSKVKTIIITAPFIDHLHLPTIESFDNEIKIISNSVVKRKIIRKGVRRQIDLVNEVKNIGPFSFSHYKAGFPYQKVAFSFVISNLKKKKVFHEGHSSNLREIETQNIKSDVAILTAESVSFFGLLNLSMNYRKTHRTLKLLDSKKLMVTGTKPYLIEGIINKFLSFNSIDLSKIKLEGVDIKSEAGDSFRI
tara:strand:+ start:49 stop:783 length:735 start_codon:yes stop_codon:yes gene_type:complete